MTPSRRIQSRIAAIESSMGRMKHAEHFRVASKPTVEPTGELNEADQFTRKGFGPPPRRISRPLGPLNSREFDPPPPFPPLHFSWATVFYAPPLGPPPARDSSNGGTAR